jgi:hypothetical protein
MHDADHHKRCLNEQIEILVAHRAASPEPDYLFVRNHARAIIQICDQAAMLDVGHDQTVDDNYPL